MATNHPQPHYGPYRPVPTPPQQNSHPTTVGTQPCYNCGSAAHIAQFCPEPRRAVPAGALAQKPRPSKSKKGSKPVITRYAPPPGYVPPQPGTIPPPPPPPPPPPSAPVVPAQSYAQQGPYPPHGPHPYPQSASSPTPQPWQSAPQHYPTPAQQWQQQQPPTPTYGPHQPPQPAYNGYAQPSHSPYAAQHSPAQTYPPHQPPYAPHFQSPHPQSPHPVYPQYGTSHVPQPPVQQPQAQQQPQTTYPPQQLQTPSYPQATHYPVPSPSFPPPKPPSHGWTPYQPPPQTNFPQFSPKVTGPTPYGRAPMRDFPRQNAHNSGQHHGRSYRGIGVAGGRSKHPPENPAPRPPSPPRFFFQPRSTAVKTVSGELVVTWKAPQRVYQPIGPVFDPEEPLATISADASPDNKKNIVGSKYFDAHGNPINREELDAEMDESKKDPVWISVRTGGTTRVDMDGYTYTLTAEDEELINQMKMNIRSGETVAVTRSTGNGDSTDTPNVQKPGESKKRSWDEFSNTSKPGQDQERRPNKRRYGNDGRNRRNNRHRHGNKAAGSSNRSAPQESASTGEQNTDNPPPPVHRSIHPLPPKPMGLPPPPPPTSSTYVDRTPLPRQHSSSHYGGEVKPVVNYQVRTQTPGNRRSASPQRQQETNYRKRDYDRTKTSGEGSSAVVSDNADARRRGTASMGVYSRRW